jgi:hypothetical protein
MGWWNEPKYVSDEGLRFYFTERARGGPSRLDCYRRLLAASADTPPSPSRATSARVAAVRHLADLFLLPLSGWRSHGAMGHELAGR